MRHDHARRPSSHAAIGSFERGVEPRAGVNVKTVAEWRKRGRVHDAVMGPREAHSTVLSVEEDAAIVAFRRHTLLPLDDCLHALTLQKPPLLCAGLRLRMGQFSVTINTHKSNFAAAVINSCRDEAICQCQVNDTT